MFAHRPKTASCILRRYPLMRTTTVIEANANEGRRNEPRLPTGPIRLSIVVPARNEENGIGDTLALLQPLRAAGHEVIVVDGGSHDATATLAVAAADRVLTASPGRASQMNAGANVASGDVLLFVHADCALPSTAADEIGAAIRHGHRWGRFDVTIVGQPRVLKLVAFMMNLRSRLTGIATGDQGIFVQRALFVRVGGYAALPLLEDVALSTTLKRVAGRPACLKARIRTSGRRRTRTRDAAATWSRSCATRPPSPSAAQTSLYAP